MTDLLQSLYGSVSAKLTTWFEAGVDMLPNFVIAVLVVLVFGLVARLAGRWSARGLARWVDSEPVSNLVGTVVRLTVVFIGIFIALSLLHLDKTVTSLLAGVGVAGLALGFAFQDIAANFMSGLLMAFKGHFEVGDVVEVAGHLGTCEAITLRATTIRTYQGLSVIIPNRDVYQRDIINYTATAERRIDIPVGVAYSDNLPLAIEAIVKEVSKIETRDDTRDVAAFFTGFGASSIDLVVHVWIDQAHQQEFLEARSEAVMAIKRAVDEAGLTIPFPIRTLDFGASDVGGENIASMPLSVVDSAPRS